MQESDRSDELRREDDRVRRGSRPTGRLSRGRAIRSSARGAAHEGVDDRSRPTCRQWGGSSRKRSDPSGPARDGRRPRMTYTDDSDLPEVTDEQLQEALPTTRPYTIVGAQGRAQLADAGPRPGPGCGEGHLGAREAELCSRSDVARFSIYASRSS